MPKKKQAKTEQVSAAIRTAAAQEHAGLLRLEGLKLREIGERMGLSKKECVVLSRGTAESWHGPRNAHGFTSKARRKHNAPIWSNDSSAGRTQGAKREVAEE